MKDGFNTERNKDWYWPWVLGAAILLGAGGIGLYLLRDSTPEIEPALDVPVADRRHARGAAAGRRRHGAAAGADTAVAAAR